MNLKLHNIDIGIYFEFYFNNNLFYSHNYCDEEMDISLFSLCEYLTHDLYKYYNYKIFTGTRLLENNILEFSFLINNIPDKLEIDQTESMSNFYPLNIKLSEEEFCLNLYLNILILAADNFEKKSFREEIIKYGIFIQQNNCNIFWRHFPHYAQAFSIEINAILNIYESGTIKIINDNNLNKTKVEDFISKISYQIENLQENSREVLNTYDEIINECNKIERGVKFLKDDIDIKNKYHFANLKNREFLDYRQGNISTLTSAQLLTCHKIMANYLFSQPVPFENENQSTVDYLQNQIESMQLKKINLVNKLYSLQEQAFEKWNN